MAAHRRHGLWIADNGYEYPLVLATVAAVIAFTGPGAASLDARLAIGDPTIESALFAVGFGLLTGAAVLVSRAAAPSADEPAADGEVETLAA